MIAWGLRVVGWTEASGAAGHSSTQDWSSKGPRAAVTGTDSVQKELHLRFLEPERRGAPSSDHGWGSLVSASSSPLTLF